MTVPLTPDSVVSENIKWLRREHHMSLEQVAAAVNRYLDADRQWTRHTVFDVEGGRSKLRKLSSSELVAVCRAFHVSLISLMLPPDGALVRLGHSELERRDYGWLVFQLRPEALEPQHLDESLPDMMHEAFLQRLVEHLPAEGLPDESFDLRELLEDDPVLAQWIDSDIAEHEFFKFLLREYIAEKTRTWMDERSGGKDDHGEY